MEMDSGKNEVLREYRLVLVYLGLFNYKHKFWQCCYSINNIAYKFVNETKVSKRVDANLMLRK